MDLALKNKRVLVTGSTSGLGEAIASMLAAEGATVIIHGRNEERGKRVVEAIQRKGGLASLVIGDLSTDGGADAVATAALVDGPVDILVNNSGAYHHHNWMQATPDKWIETYESNVLSGVRMIQRLVPFMRARKWGRVITIGGGLGVQPIPQHPDYNASLAARHNLALSLARELKNSGVTSNIVSPGAIRVASVEQYLYEVAPKLGWSNDWEEIEKNTIRDFVPNDVGRLGKPEEIAAAVAYLCSPFADYISGTALRVDGGTVRAL